MMLFLSRSILLKTMPEFASAGSNLIEAFFPECRPIPSKIIVLDIVFEIFRTWGDLYPIIN